MNSIKEQNKHYKKQIKKLEKEEKMFEKRNNLKSKFLLKIIRTMKRNYRQKILQTPLG
jgi:hypothetical protein